LLTGKLGAQRVIFPSAAICWATTARNLDEKHALHRNIPAANPEAFAVHPCPRAEHEQQAPPALALDRKQRDALPAICDIQEEHGRS